MQILLETKYVPLATKTVSLFVAAETAGWILVAAVSHDEYGNVCDPDGET
ncbi:MAG: hypothetical protein L6437_07085 [Kiritimatiellae bacterium]|nr:hypothetical protein [Kiritimatiellia bacterium]